MVYGYDSAGRLTDLTTTAGVGPGAATIASPTTYDVAGNVVAQGDWAYQYDKLGRLVRAEDSSSAEVFEYAYDLASNRTEVKRGGNTSQSLSFGPANEIDTTTDPQFAYDAAGRLISDTSAAGNKRHYIWDGASRLTGIDLYQVETGHYRNLRMSYDASGRLVQKDTYLDLTYLVERLYFHYDGARLTAELDDTGVVREYLYAGGEAPTAMRSRNSDGSYSNYFFVTNTHGDVVAVTDKDGNLVNRYAYGPWGEATMLSERVHQPFRYSGYRYEDGFDLYYLRARWYDAGTGRFLSRDPYRGDNFLLPSLNRYIYAQSAPPTMKDPAGLSPSKPRRPFSWRNLGTCPGSNLPLRGHGNSLRRWLQSQYYSVDIIDLRIDFVESPGGGNNLGYAERSGHWWGGPALNKVELRDDVDLCDSSEPPPVKPSLYVLLHELAHFEAFSGGSRQSCNFGTVINIESRQDEPDEMYASCRGLQVLKTYNATLDLESYVAGFEPSPPGVMAGAA